MAYLFLHLKKTISLAAIAYLLLAGVEFIRKKLLCDIA